MPTATKPSAAERELEQALADVIAERNETENRAHEHRSRINGLKDRLAERAISNPSDFGATGLPKQRTESGKIAAEVAELERADNFAAMVNGAQGRVERAEEELRRHRADAARDLLVEMVPEAREKVDEWMAWVAQGERIRRELIELAHRATRVVTTSRLYRGDARVVPSYEHQSHILNLARGEPPLPLPDPLVQELEAEEKEAEDE
jgi:hypothetical protein